MFPAPDAPLSAGPVAVLQLPELEDLQKDVVRVEARDEKARGPVAEPAPHDVVAQECRRRMHHDLDGVGAPAFAEPLFGRQRRVMVDADDVIGNVAVGVVLKIVPQRRRPSSRQLHRLVHALAVEPPDAAIVEAQLIVRIPVRAADPASEIVRHARHAEAADVGPGAHDLLDFGCQRRRNALVGIDGQNPVVGGDGGGVVPLRAVPFPVVDDDARGEALGERHRLVRAVGVDDDDFVGPFDGLEGALDICGFVAGDDRDGQLHMGECSTRRAARRSRLARFGSSVAR